LPRRHRGGRTRAAVRLSSCIRSVPAGYPRPCVLHALMWSVVVVTAEHEILLIPRRHNPLLHWIDGMRGSTPVLAQWRAHGREREPYAVATHVGRHPLGRMRELAHAA
jgi:hypothetical protein